MCDHTIQLLPYLCCASGERPPNHARTNITNTMKRNRHKKMSSPLNLYQYSSASCSRYLIITFPVSFDSPSERTPNENGTSAIACGGIWALMSRSSAILKP